MPGIKTGTVTCPHCGEKSKVAVQEGGGRGDPPPGGGGGPPGTPGGGGDSGEGGDEPQEPKQIPHIEWDETFKAPTDREAVKKAKDAVEKQMEEFFDEEEEDATAGKGKGAGKDSGRLGDLKKARKGTMDSRSEFQSIEKGGDDPPDIQGMFTPLSDLEPLGPYKDSKFKREMDQRLKKWRTGVSRKTGKTGESVDVSSYVRTGRKQPFTKYKRLSVKGKKYLFVLDFSGCISDSEDEYKKAIINTMEALQGIGAKTAVFGFGGFTVGGGRDVGRFKVKTFEEGGWRPVHASKVAGVEANGGTPTGQAYSSLERYIKRHRPEYVITLTDGAAGDSSTVERMNKELKRSTKMVAFGIADDKGEEAWMKSLFDGVGYGKTFTVTKDEMHRIPERLVDLIAPRS